MEPSVLHQRMQFLAERGLISYRPPMELPSVKFLTPRITLTKRELNWEKYEFLEKRKEQRLLAMLDYTAANGICRSRKLETYFGEDNGEDCGICDVCESHSMTLSVSLRKAITAEIQNRLATAPETFEVLARNLKTGNERFRKEVLRALMDTQKIRVKADFTLEWVK